MPPLPEGLAQRATSFGVLADAYDRYRPGYPEAVVDDLLAGLAEHDRALRGLDIGAGTGRATLALAARGVAMTALEPDAGMVRVLVRRAIEAGVDVDVCVGTFEARMPLEGAPRFDVVVSAQAFHWTEPETRWRRLAAVLAPGGVAGLCWNNWRLDPAAHPHSEVAALYARLGDGRTPDLADPDSERHPGVAQPAQEGVFGSVELRRHPWTRELPVADYLALLGTTSQYSVWDANARARLFDALGALLGPVVTLDGWTDLTLLSL